MKVTLIPIVTWVLGTVPKCLEKMLWNMKVTVIPIVTWVLGTVPKCLEKRLWNMKVTVIPIVTWVLGTVPKCLEKRLWNMRVKIILVSALGMVSMNQENGRKGGDWKSVGESKASRLQHCWDRLENWEESWRSEETCCGDLLSLRLQWKSTSLNWCIKLARS